MAKVVLNKLTGSNATLAYNNNKDVRVFNFWLMEFSQDHSLTGSNHQSKTYQHFYGRSYAPGALQIVGRVRDQEQYNNFAQFVREHHLQMINNPGVTNARQGGLRLMSLHIESEALYYTGWIKSFEGGVKRFNVAPQVNFGFEVVNDRHSTNDSIVPASVRRAAFTGSFLTGAVSESEEAKRQAGTWIDANPVSKLFAKKPS